MAQQSRLWTSRKSGIFLSISLVIVMSIIIVSGQLIKLSHVEKVQFQSDQEGFFLKSNETPIKCIDQNRQEIKLQGSKDRLKPENEIDPEADYFLVYEKESLWQIIRKSF